MHIISVPVHIERNFDKEAALQALKKAKAKYVFLSPSKTSVKKSSNDKQIEILRDLVPFFQKNGLKVGVWIWSLWVADFEPDTISDYVMKNYKGGLHSMGSPLNSNEKICSGFICPTSEKAVKIMTDFIKDITALSPDIILFDDDLDYTTHMGSFGCYCDRHLKLISDRLGYQITREELSQKVTEGKPCEIRSEWMKIMGETLENYAKEIRKAVDSINPQVRFGHCSVMSQWGIDGTTPEKLAKLFAGNTKPFFRLIGAPYWAMEKNWCRQLQHVIETERMEYAWVEDKNIEILTEGDVYPRPRHKVPAKYLEIFDTALRFAGVGSGIHKYMLDYTSKIGYETGYLEHHLKNAPIYEKIEEFFADKTDIGVRVYETLEKIKDADFTGIENPHRYIADSFFSNASKLLANNTIPTTFSGNSTVGIAFGENARHLPKEAFENGLILDIRAAKILMEKGVDVGIEKIGKKLVNNLLYFPDYDDFVVTGYGKDSAYELTLKENANVVIYSDDNSKRYADAFHYENADGQRFLVYGFDAAFTEETRFRNYLTQRQLCDSIEWLSGKKMTAKCLGNPDLYMLTKQNDEGLGIGLWNIFADEIFKPIIELDRQYTSAEFINCSGKLNGNILELSEISPFGFAFVNLK